MANQLKGIAIPHRRYAFSSSCLKDKQLKVQTMARGYTIHIGQDEIHPKELQKLLMKIDGTPEEALISRLTLRSMKA